MASATHQAKPITIDLRKYKEKDHRRSEGPTHSQQTSTNNGSLPKRYQSVFTEGTPLTSFGVRHDDNHPRTHSPPNHLQPQPHHRQLQPVKEFLATGETHGDDRRRSHAQTSTFPRVQNDPTVQNVNAALTRTLNKLRPESTTTVTASNRSTPMYAVPTPARPMTARAHVAGPSAAAAASNYYYPQLPGASKAPLPAELITRRPTSSFASNVLPNGTSHSRISTSSGPLIAPPTVPIRTEIKTNENANVRTSTPIRPTVKAIETGLQQLDGFNFDNVTLDEQNDKIRSSKAEANPSSSSKSTSRKQSATARPLPEVSVNPQIQSAIQSTNDPHPSRPTSAATNADTNSHHINVNPTNTLKRNSSPLKHPQVVDVQPAVIVQHQRPNSAAHAPAPSSKDPLNDAYLNRDNDSTSTLKQYDNQPEKNQGQGTNSNPSPPASPSAKELNRVWKKPKHKYSFRTATAAIVTRRQHPQQHNQRPPGRLKNYGDESESDSTATETQSPEDEGHRRHGALPSDLGSDAWSDLTSEFSDTKLRKHPNIRTSTPNITRYSSSISSKEVGQIRKQLTDLQIMYNDLLKLLDVDIESARGSFKSSNSSQVEYNGRKHRFRKVAPASSFRHANLDMRSINERFGKVEASIVTLAESIAKLSAQIQMQRVIKDDVYNLRQEVAELHRFIHRQGQSQSAHPMSAANAAAAGGRTSSMSTTSHQQSRLITPNIQRLAAVNSTNPLNISTSYMPSTSTIQRANSIVDLRQARKIEQFFGAEAMLRYFLSVLNYEEYAPILEQEKIGFYELPYITERKLHSLGIPYGPCARIIYEAQQYFISLLTLKSSGIDV